MPIIFIVGAIAFGAVLVFGHSGVTVGLILMACGVLALTSYLGSMASRRRPGESETVIEERHYIGNHDDHERYHH